MDFCSVPIQKWLLPTITIVCTMKNPPTITIRKSSSGTRANGMLENVPLTFMIFPHKNFRTFSAMSTQAMTSRRVSPPHPHHPSTNFTCEGTKGVKIAIVIGVIQTYDGYVELIYSYIYISSGNQKFKHSNGISSVIAPCSIFLGIPGLVMSGIAIFYLQDVMYILLCFFGWHIIMYLYIIIYLYIYIYIIYLYHISISLYTKSLLYHYISIYLYMSYIITYLTFPISIYHYISIHIVYILSQLSLPTLLCPGFSVNCWAKNGECAASTALCAGISRPSACAALKVAKYYRKP